MSSKYSRSRPHVPNALRRQAMIEAGYTCSIRGCGEHTYLELHHINGNREDNRLENVIVLCDKHHKMAEYGEIDRLALKEYKRLNRERLGLSQTYHLPQPSTIEYLQRFADWLNEELMRMETSPILPSTSDSHIPPSLRFHCGKPSSQRTDDAVFSAIDESLKQHSKILLLGNGGSGKTVTLLSWLHHQCRIAQQQDNELIPVFVPLHLLTPKTNILSLVRSALGKHGVNLTVEQLETLLQFGLLCIVFDGLNEIHHKALEEGALEEVISFLDTYPDSCFIVSSRYTTSIKDWNLATIKMDAWDIQQIQKYLNLRLGTDLGERTYASIGDSLDLEWMHGCSVAGICSNPLTLWMLATVVEETQSPPSKDEEIVDSLVDLIVKRTPETQRRYITPRVLKELLEDFAYLMLDWGDVLSTSYENALELSVQLIQERKKFSLLPAGIDSYQLLNTLLTTGLLRRVDEERVEWTHQVLQERLSSHSSKRRFGHLEKLTDITRCPSCSYNPDRFMEQDGQVWGECEGCSEAFKVKIPIIPNSLILQNKVFLVDNTGLPKEPGKTSIPNSLHDERWLAFLCAGSAIYIKSLMYAQDDRVKQPVLREKLDVFGIPRQVFDLDVWVLAEAGIFRIEQEEDVSTVYIYIPPVNPSWRLVNYELVVLRDLSPDELEDDPEEERFRIISAKRKKYLEERRKKNLPIYHSYSFSEEDKQKVFSIAQKVGGRVIRRWGSYEEVIAEFAGEAWDFSKFNSEQDIQLESAGQDVQPVKYGEQLALPLDLEFNPDN